MKTLLIVDGNNIAHRVKYKFSLSNAGMDVSVTYGFISVLLSYMRKFKPAAIITCWDGGIPNYRREKVPSYKANRSHGDDDPWAYQDFIRQMDELIQEALPLMGVLTVRKRYVEADDLAYHAAFMAQDNYDRIIVASADEDLMQCTLIPRCVVLNPNKNELRGSNWIEAEYNINPKDFVHWRALQGDSSDNIAGVVGIGPKTATKLFQQYNSISGIVNAAGGSNPAGKIDGKLGSNIRMFGLEGIAKNVYTMVLAFDRTGARFPLLDEAWFWEPADTNKMKRYLLKNAFVSLMEGDLYKLSKALCKPELNDNLRVPIIYGQRRPVL